MIQNSNNAGATASPSVVDAAPIFGTSSADDSATVAATVTATIQPKVVVIRRRPNQGFGFTLRHFIAYPPEDDPDWPLNAATNVLNSTTSEPNSPLLSSQTSSSTKRPVTTLSTVQGSSYQVKAMETIFIKEVQANGPAHYANLKTGDRVLMVNNTPISGIAYSTIVSMIKQTPAVLTLHVVPKECDVLQMHYTSIAHTPESNRLSLQRKQPIALSSLALANSSEEMLPSSAVTSFPQHQLISQPVLAHAANVTMPGAIQRSGGSTATTALSTSNRNMRQPILTGSSNTEFGTMTHQNHCQQPQQSHYYQPIQNLHFHHHQKLLSLRSREAIVPNGEISSAIIDAAITDDIRANQSEINIGGNIEDALKHPYITVTTSVSNNTSALWTTKTLESNDLMIRLRESIKQKEKFLKSPLPPTKQHIVSDNCGISIVNYGDVVKPQTQYFFPPTSPPTNKITANESNFDSYNTIDLEPESGQKQNIVKQQSTSKVRYIADKKSNCDTHDCHIKTMSVTVNQYDGNRASSEPYISGGRNDLQQPINLQRQNKSCTPTSNYSSKYTKDLDFYESLQETGVTNKVFERKLVSHMAKGFDPFKPLSINTNAIDIDCSVEPPGNTVLVKKPGVLYDSLQHHPLHQMQVQQLQYTSYQLPKLHQSSVVDGQIGSSRMELQTATAVNNQNHRNPNTALADITENIDLTGINVTTLIDTSNVVRRSKPVANSIDENKPMRRISYLRATNNEIDYQAVSLTPSRSGEAHNGTEKISQSKIMISKNPDPNYDIISSGHEFIETPNGLEDIRVMRSGSGIRRTSINGDLRASIHTDNISIDVNDKLETKDVVTELEVFESELEIKSPCFNGKRTSEYRSWKQVKIEIKGDILKIYPTRTTKLDGNVLELDIRNFKFFDESVDKKKHIFRMQSKPSHLVLVNNDHCVDYTHDKVTSSGSSASAASTVAQSLDQAQHTEILFKTKTSTEMKRIFGLLQWKNSLVYDDNVQRKQQSESQKIADNTLSHCDNPTQTSLAPTSEYSPISSTSGSILESAITITSDSISPMMKTRKSNAHKNGSEKELGSPKAKNWKDLLFRRGGNNGNHSADISPSNLTSSAKTTGSIGVPLKNCPMSKSNEFVPNLVTVCTNIVETKGLGVVGIYRIPGNKAAISELSDQVNKNDFSWDRCNSDVRWEDVNVVSSLLKLFIRSLPDALLPSSFYNHFIEADKKPGLARLKELKNLLESLPRYSYETMKHLICHLNRVSKNCDVNRMEPKNLAIIFGPSIIRTPNDTLEIAVKDMKHQCRIVELLLTQYEYFFENGNTPNLTELSITTSGAGEACNSVCGINSAIAQSKEDQTNMLLHNVSKIERFTERETRTSRFIPQLRRRTHSKRSTFNSDTYSGESVLSLDYAKINLSRSSSGSTTQSNSGCGSINNTQTPTDISKISKSAPTSKKKERNFLSSRPHHRKASLDEKDSNSVSISGGNIKEQRSSIDISVFLTDDESSNSRLSDTGSMSLTTITDALDTKLRNLRSGSESNDENGSPEYPKSRRHTLGQPLHLHSENIPFADESPERLFHNFCSLDAPQAISLNHSCTTSNTITAAKSNSLELEKEYVVRGVASLASGGTGSAHKLQHSATMPMSTSLTINQNSSLNPTQIVAVQATTNSKTSIVKAIGNGSGTLFDNGKKPSAHTSIAGKNLRFDQCIGSEDDSEGSTTSDPKETFAITSPSFFLDRYNKKRRDRDHRLFRSASFNCRNYSSRHPSGLVSSNATGGGASSSLTKDEKTDMNLTKKRQIQNKQNRSIKRRHTVGGTHDYINKSNGNAVNVSINTNSTTTAVLRRISITSGNSNNVAPSGNNNNSTQSDGNNGNGSCMTVSGNGGNTIGSPTVDDIGIRTKSTNRGRY